MDFVRGQSEVNERAAKTLFPVLAPIHHHIRTRIGWYQRWHNHPHAHKVHWAALFVGIAISSAIIASNLALPGGSPAAKAQIPAITGPTITVLGPNNGTIMGAHPILSMSVDDSNHGILVVKAQFQENTSSDCTGFSFSSPTVTDSNVDPSLWNNGGLYDTASGPQPVNVSLPGNFNQQHFYCWQAEAGTAGTDPIVYGDWSTIQSFGIDHDAPRLASLSLNQIYNASSMVDHFSGMVADDNLGVGLEANSAQIQIYRQSGGVWQTWTGVLWTDSAVWLTTTHDTTNDGSAVPWSSNIALPPWEDGTYYVDIRALDRIGNAFDGDNLGFVYDATAPTAPPAVNIVRDGVTPDGKNRINPGSSISVMWNAASDATSGIDHYQAAISTTIGNVPDDSWHNSTETSTTITELHLVEGQTYYAMVRAIDRAGNVGAFTTSVGVVAAQAIPSTISDLSASADSESSVTLTWTAPGSDGNTGKVSSYDIRYSTSDISDGNFSNGTSVAFTDTPQSAGSKETIGITNLSADTTYHFAMKTRNKAGQTSSISNIATASTNANESEPTTTQTTENGTPSVSVSIDSILQTIVSTSSIHVSPNSAVSISAKPSTIKAVSSVTFAFPNSTITVHTGSSGIYETSIQTPVDTGSYDGRVTVTYKDGTTEQQIVHFLVDPSGYIYDQADNHRIAGSLITLMVKSGDAWIVWNGDSFNQKNPQTTNSTGEYSFYVPSGTYQIKAEMDGYQSFTSDEFTVRIQPITLSIPLTKTGTTTVAATSTTDTNSANPIQKTLSSIRSQLAPVVSSPFVRTTSTVANVTAAATVSIGILLPIVANLPLIDPIGFVLAWLFSILGDRKQKRWGVVRDAESNQPVPFAQVRILTAKEGKLLDSQTTDTVGQFAFFVPTGTYTVQVSKPNYVFPSKIDSTGYKGGLVSIQDNEVINLDVPIDPAISVVGHRLKLLDTFEQLAHAVRLPILLLGTITSLVFLISATTALNGAVFTLYCFSWMYELISRRVNHTSIGHVVDSGTKQGLSLAIVRIFDNVSGKLMLSKVSDKQGQYAVFVGKGSYHATVTREYYERFTSEAWDEFSSHNIVEKTFPLTDSQRAIQAPRPVAVERITPIQQQPAKEVLDGGTQIERGPDFTSVSFT